MYCRPIDVSFHARRDAGGLGVGQNGYMSFRNGVLPSLLSTRMQLSITRLNTLDYFDYLLHGPPHKEARFCSSSTVMVYIFLGECRLPCVKLRRMIKKEKIKLPTSLVKTMYSFSGSSDDGVWEVGKQTGDVFPTSLGRWVQSGADCRICIHLCWLPYQLSYAPGCHRAQQLTWILKSLDFLF